MENIIPFMNIKPREAANQSILSDVYFRGPPIEPSGCADDMEPNCNDDGYDGSLEESNLHHASSATSSGIPSVLDNSQLASMEGDSWADWSVNDMSKLVVPYCFDFKTPATDLLNSSDAIFPIATMESEYSSTADAVTSPLQSASKVDCESLSGIDPSSLTGSFQQMTFCNDERQTHKSTLHAGSEFEASVVQPSFTNCSLTSDATQVRIAF